MLKYGGWHFLGSSVLFGTDYSSDIARNLESDAYKLRLHSNSYLLLLVSDLKFKPVQEAEK